MKLFHLLALVLTSVTLFSPTLLMGQMKYSGLYYDSQSDQYFINDKVSFTIRPTEDEKYLDKIQYSVDNGPYQDYAGNIKLEKDGLHIVRFKAVDPVLNWSPTQSFRIYVDLTTPESSADWLGESYSDGQNLYISEKAELILSAQDNLSGIQKIRWQEKNEDKINIYSSKKNFKEGTYAIRLSAIDNVGNEEPWKDFNFIVDGTPPQADAKVSGNSYKKGEKLYFDKGSFVTISASDNLSGLSRIEYKLNDGPISIYNQRISITDSLTSIKYRSLDKVGNLSEWKGLTVHLDSIPPELKLTHFGQYEKIAGKIFARSGFKINASVFDKESGASNIIIGDNKYKDVSQKDIDFKEPGEHGIYFNAEDNVGNSANPTSYTIVIDESSPKTEIKSSNAMINKDGTFISSLPNKIDFEAEDSGVGVKYTEISYDGKNFSKVTSPIDLATWDSGNRTVYYRSTDKLGNIEVTKKMNIYVRKSGPKVDLFVESGDSSPSVPLSKLQDNKRIPASKK